MANEQRHSRPPRTDQHVITTHDLGPEARDGHEVEGWTASCSCGWKSRVFSEYEDIAIEAARKHADWVEKRWLARDVHVHISVKANEKVDAGAIQELVKLAERGAS